MKSNEIQLKLMCYVTKVKWCLSVPLYYIPPSVIKS